MPGKHQESWVARLSRNRYPLVIAVVLLCIGVAGVFAAIANRRSPSRPLMYIPVSSPSASLVPSPAPSPSLSPSPSPSVPASPSPSRTRSPSPSRTPSRSPSAAPSFTARYVVVDGRRSSFQVGVVITNTGKAARSWRLVVTHDPDAGVRVQGAFGAELSTSGDTITLRGEALEPGRRVTVGFRATSDRSRDEVRPTSCTIEGTACEVTSGRYRNETAARTR